MDTPLVSVLMTAYNRERYIGAAIESVLASTFSNFELIITDDRSSDNTVSIAEIYAQKDPRVKVYINKQNLGDYSNRNKAASHARGKYLKYVDADDYIYPWGLEHLVEMMEQFPDAGWGLCSLDQNELQPFPILLTPQKAYRYEYFGPGIFHKAPLSTIILKDIFWKHEGFSGKKHLGDYEFWHKLALKENVVLMPQGLVWHRIHDDQQSADNRQDPRVPFKYLIFAITFLKNEPLIPFSIEEKKIAIRKLRIKAYKSIVREIFQFNASSVIALIRDFNNKNYKFE